MICVSLNDAILSGEVNGVSGEENGVSGEENGVSEEGSKVIGNATVTIRETTTSSPFSCFPIQSTHAIKTQFLMLYSSPFSFLCLIILSIAIYALLVLFYSYALMSSSPISPFTRPTTDAHSLLILNPPQVSIVSVLLVSNTEPMHPQGTRKIPLFGLG